MGTDRNPVTTDEAIRSLARAYIDTRGWASVDCIALEAAWLRGGGCPHRSLEHALAELAEHGHAEFDGTRYRITPQGRLYNFALDHEDGKHDARAVAGCGVCSDLALLDPTDEEYL